MKNEITPALKERIARRAAKKSESPIKGLPGDTEKAPNPVLGWPEVTSPPNANETQGGN